MTAISLSSGTILQQSATSSPKVGFLPTASADSDAFLVKFYDTLSGLACQASHLELFGRVPDPAGYINSQAGIFVGGGNTKSMLGVWREWALDTLLREAWESGTVLAGWSAGAICWFDQGVSDAWADRLAPISGLGMLPGSCCPHYSNEPERRPTYHQLLIKGEIVAGVGIDDGCAIHFQGRSPACVVATRGGPNAYSVSVNGTSILDTPLPVERIHLPATSTCPPPGEER